MRIEPSVAFDQMIAHCERLQVPLSYKQEVLRVIGYLKQQSLADLDRRAPSRSLQEAWQSLERKTKGTGLFETFRKNVPVWSSVLDFVELSDPQFQPVLGQPKGPAPNKKAYENWEAEQILRDILHRALLLVPPGQDKLVLKLILHYLIIEAQQARGKRNQSFIKEVWLIAWPLLDKYKLLEAFRSYEQPRRRMEFFIKGSF